MLLFYVFFSVQRVSFKRKSCFFFNTEFILCRSRIARFGDVLVQSKINIKKSRVCVTFLSIDVRFGHAFLGTSPLINGEQLILNWYKKISIYKVRVSIIVKRFIWERTFAFSAQTKKKLKAQLIMLMSHSLNITICCCNFILFQIISDKLDEFYITCTLIDIFIFPS